MNEFLPTQDGTTLSVNRARNHSESFGTKGVLTGHITRATGEVEALAPSTNARVNAGFSAQVAVTFSGSASASFQYMALTATSITPAIGDTALSGEITTNGCARYGPVTPTVVSLPTTPGGTGVIQFSHTWTATGSQTINSMGLLNAASGGVLFSELLLSSTVTLASGDSLTLNYQITF